MSTSVNQAETKTEKLLAKALHAIGYTLRRISDHGVLGYYFGATQGWSLLTEAYAAVSDKRIVVVQEQFRIKKSDPFEGRSDQNIVEELQKRGFKVADKNGEQCERQPKDEWQPTMLEVFTAVDDMSSPDRLEFFHLIRDRFCLQCGGVCIVKPCGCSPRK